MALGVGSVSNRNEYQWYLLGGGGGEASGAKVDILSIFMCQLSRNSGTLNLLEPDGLSRPVILTYSMEQSPSSEANQ